ncbi:helix-turn-helix transcriptional regulator [Butyrivibrio sp.]|uniref:helix-turn-helix domain-containing protein n=1 Tax=Butyrivibrio sp. TaxID=28121 RepID=UPI0025BDDF04|nr:helix-turn-helix transcriptional regulator [Butyrivibrio sp.]MBQ9305829.1 helix-turn-helix transcriptional regulator [Butyrivibrio sp.]
MSFSEVRRAKGYTQKKLAQSTGISQSAIANYESGKRRPDMIRAKRMAEVLNISLDDIYEFLGISSEIS